MHNSGQQSAAYTPFFAKIATILLTQLHKEYSGQHDVESVALIISIISDTAALRTRSAQQSAVCIPFPANTKG